MNNLNRLKLLDNHQSNRRDRQTKTKIRRAKKDKDKGMSKTLKRVSGKSVFRLRPKALNLGAFSTQTSGINPRRIGQSS